MIVGGVVVLVIVILALVYFGMRPKTNTGPAITLTVWGTESSAALTSVLVGYPYGKVSYVQMDPANYASQLLSALAAGRGPDIFEINDRDLPQWKSVVAPLPTSSTFGLLALQQYFPDVVAQDFVSGGQIYGLPLSIDTLAMIYNKDLLNSANIAILPATWDDFDADVPRLCTINAQGQLTQAAAAIGGSLASVTNAPDLLSLLMLQNGTVMTNDGNTAATFAEQNSGTLGADAFDYYLQFANAASPYYTWNDGMGNDFDSFVAGKTAVIFAYQSDLVTIEAKAPFLNVGIAPMPQAKGASVAINYPSYNGFVVARAGQQAAAWNLILYLTTTPAVTAAYQTASGKAPALRTQIQADANDPALSVFAEQALTARSWYEADAAEINGIFDTAIKKVLNGAEDSTTALKEAEAAVTQLMR